MSIVLKTREEAYEALESGDLVACESWRWGTLKTYVFARDGRHYRFQARFHSEEGLQDECPIEAEEVVARERVSIEWVPGTAALPNGVVPGGASKEET